MKRVALTSAINRIVALIGHAPQDERVRYTAADGLPVNCHHVHGGMHDEFVAV